MFFTGHLSRPVERNLGAQYITDSYFNWQCVVGFHRLNLVVILTDKLWLCSKLKAFVHEVHSVKGR
jgi:hypothetical protein